jgi:hypothetical protein
LLLTLAICVCRSKANGGGAPPDTGAIGGGDLKGRRFEGLSSLPPGAYTIKAWHEKLETSTQTITTGANQTKEISRFQRDVTGLSVFLES